MVTSTAGCFNAPPFDPGQVVVSVPVGGNYCQLWFPAIREDTLFTSRPRLKDPAEGDLIFMRGPCDYDPLGSEEVQRQRADARRDRRRDNR
jgi:hypothetical protein